MAIESPLKKDIDACTVLLDRANKAYQKYFIGMEKLPPFEIRKDLDTKVNKLKSDMNKVHQTSIRFLINGVVAKYHSFISQWDKTMKDIEEGRYHRKPKRV
jgi:hypothetical protein